MLVQQLWVPLLEYKRHQMCQVAGANSSYEVTSSEVKLHQLIEPKRTFGSLIIGSLILES